MRRRVMTEEYKNSIREQYRKSADIQADALIEAVDFIDKQMPAGTTEEQRYAYINMIMANSKAIMEASAKEMAQTMMAQDLSKVMEEVNGKL